MVHGCRTVPDTRSLLHVATNSLISPFSFRHISTRYKPLTQTSHLFTARWIGPCRQTRRFPISLALLPQLIALASR